MTTKIYEVVARSLKYPGNSPSHFNVVAGSVMQAVQRCRKEIAYHEEIENVNLVARAE